MNYFPSAIEHEQEIYVTRLFFVRKIQSHKIHGLGMIRRLFRAKFLSRFVKFCITREISQGE